MSDADVQRLARAVLNSRIVDEHDIAHDPEWCCSACKYVFQLGDYAYPLIHEVIDAWLLGEALAALVDGETVQYSEEWRCGLCIVLEAA